MKNNTEDMNLEKELELLKGIRKVDAPPFLYTRIEQKLKSSQENYIGKKSFAFSFAVLCIIIILNVSVILKFNSANSKSKTELIIENFNLTESNTLYHE